MKDLLKRREQAEARFNELAKQREQKQSELTELDAELSRLQGEYRLLNELIEKDTPVSQDAATVDATKAEVK